MTREEIVKIVNGFLVDEFEIEENMLKENASFLKDLGIDSLDIVDIVVAVEKNFGFKMQTEEVKTIKTLADFYDYILKKVNE